MKIAIQLLNEGAVLPERMSNTAAGYDLFASVNKPQIIAPGSIQLISTGIALSIPSGFEAQIRPRSGLALKNGIGILNSPGTIDSDYRGEIKVILFNFSDRDFIVTDRMRIAQMIISRVESVNFQLVDKLDETDRGAGGFGHTGV